MRSRLLARLKTLESQTELAKRPELILVGWLSPLPADHSGILHVVATSHPPGNESDVQWCEFEERVGPASPDAAGLIRVEQRKRSAVPDGER